MACLTHLTRLLTNLAALLCLGLLLAHSAHSAHAEDGMLQLEIGRGEARMPAYAMESPAAQATLILLPGGDSGTGAIVDGQPQSGNFLVRSREFFRAAGYNVLILFRPTDLNTLDLRYRATSEHIAEIRTAVQYARQRYGKPVWLVGTSRGTVSGAAAAIVLGPELVNGLVLTSSITNQRASSITSFPLEKIVVPVLVVHHQWDACRFCVPGEAERAMDRFSAAPMKKFVLVEGGRDPIGDPCEAKHWHGYINYEAETVKLVTDWITSPAKQSPAN